MFFIPGILIAAFLSLLLIVKKNKSRADKILILWLILISVSQIFNYLNIKKITYQYPDWLGVDFGMPILIGVFLFFYVREITGTPLNNIWEIALHALPTILIYIQAIPFYGLSGVEKVCVYENEGVGYEWFVVINNLTIAISGLGYAIWSIILINKYRIEIRDNFSNTDRKELQWLWILSFGLATIWVFSAFFDNHIIYSIVTVFVLSIGIFGINRLNIFNSNLKPETIKTKSVSPKTNNDNSNSLKKSVVREKYAKSGLNESLASEIYANLNKVMNDKAFYENENLTLVELSKELQIHPNHLSQVINEMEGKNFYNYINAFRIEKFIEIASLPENKKYTMIALAYECGFSSKSTFNKHFKLYTGTTPTEYFRV